MKRITSTQRDVLLKINKKLNYDLNKIKYNKINKIYKNINEYNNNPDIQLPTNNIYDNLINKGPLGNLMKNFDILNNIDIHNNMKDDNIILDEELTNNKLKNSNINIDDGELNNTELNNTEIESESDEESYFIPIYRSKKKKNDKPQFV